MLDAKALGLSFGILTGLGIAMMGLLAMYGIGVPLVHAIGVYYLGFTPTLPGIVIGLVWGLLEGTIIGFLLATLYNKLAVH